MPELPEVEIVKQSLAKKIQKKKIKKVIIRNRNLRFKIPAKFEGLLENKIIKKVSRFSKYLILSFLDGSFCLIHLGMSGTIHLIKKSSSNKFTNASFYNSPNLPKKHNHVEIQFNDIKVVYNTSSPTSRSIGSAIQDSYMGSMRSMGSTRSRYSSHPRRDRKTLRKQTRNQDRNQTRNQDRNRRDRRDRPRHRDSYYNSEMSDSVYTMSRRSEY
mgnify:CR=1 FL=1